MKKDIVDFFTGKGSRQGMWVLPLFVAIVLALWLSIRTEQFLTTNNVANIVAQGMPLAITAIGQMFVIVIGGLDLSVGSVISFTTAVLALGGSVWLMLPLVFLLAALVGAANGIIITRFNVHPIIATLSMQYILLGITRVLRPVSGGSVPDAVIASVSGSLFSMPDYTIAGRTPRAAATVR